VICDGSLIKDVEDEANEKGSNSGMTRWNREKIGSLGWQGVASGTRSD